MLQIISEKYFNKEEKINKQTEYDVLYSNFHSYLPIKTEIFEIVPIKSYPEKINKFLIIYENKYQPRDDKDIIVLSTGDTIIQHIKFLLTFYFGCYFHREKSHIEKLCSNNKNPNDVENIAYLHLPHIFQPTKRDDVIDLEDFKVFINEILLLNRKSYNLLIKLLNAYYNSIESFETNYELSYMTLVYLLETLISDLNKYQPKWNDFDQNRREKLENIFNEIDSEKVEEIKNILLKDSNLKLRSQFVNGLYNITKDEFYLPSKKIRGNRLLKSDLLYVLNNLYTTRSKYVHKLDSLEEVVNTYGYEKTNFTYDKNDPKFSIYGLLNYTKYIIDRYIEISEKLTIEEYDWRSELPGIIKGKLAPQYWVWRSEGFSRDHLSQKFNGFIELLSQNKFIDIKDLLVKIEKMFEQLNEEDFASAFTIYTIFNLSVKEEDRLNNYKVVIEKYTPKVNKCFIQYMIMGLFLNGLPAWSGAELENTLNNYFKKKYRSKSIKLPNIIEVKLYGFIANKYSSDDSRADYLRNIDNAIYNSVNNRENYEYLNEIKKEFQQIDLSKLK